ncbi:Transcription elongation factor TFIIS [Carex littledalei]|uniref:Transcription elongation factor n=1 Tax=Carex littledalei TaxID=544730 RepID=A0A833R7P9_9POAL|nr:Transcription elongation factor TFIIS [Carex littledalei]
MDYSTERELLEIFEAAKKAADAASEDGGASPEADRCIDALNRLREIKVTTAVLVSTQVGKRLRSLTKHPHSEIQSVASELITFWKNIVVEENSNGKKNGQTEKSSNAGKPVKTESKPKLEKPQLAQPEKIKARPEKRDVKPETPKSEKKPLVKEERKPAVSVERKAPAVPKLSALLRCNDTNRDRIRELMAEAFFKVSGETEKDDREEVRNILDEVEEYDPLRVAVTAESALFAKLGGSTGAQKHKYRSIMFNLRADNNTDFRRKVLTGQIKPERLANLTPEEMASDARKMENKQIKDKALFDCERSGAPKATTDQFKCGRCGQRKTTYYQLQTRSADEPMTTFVTCVNCNNHWKFC